MRGAAGGVRLPDPASARCPESRWKPDGLVIETPFTLRDTAGSCHELDPNTSRSALAPVIDLFFKSITGVTVTDRGTLTLDFDDGAQLIVSPHPQYESWELQGQGISGILVGPGGETGWPD